MARPTTFLGRRIWQVCAAAAALAIAGGVAWKVQPPPPAPPPPAPPPLLLRVAGQELAMQGDAVAAALDLVRRYAKEQIALKLPDGTERLLRPAQLGAEIDRVRLAEFIKAALREDSEIVRAFRARQATDPKASLDVPIPIHIHADRTISLLVSIKDEIDHPATDATVDVDKRELVPERFGFRLDVYASAAALEAGLRSGATEVAAIGERIPPRVVAAQLGNVKFDQVLGFFSTRYSESSQFRARTDNLRLAASRLDGTVLMPGEEFDFNGVVGPRDEANGYKVAPVIAQGELVDGIGGGTCQVSGTLHAAAFFAGLTISERVPHTRPSSYLYIGLDAAVAYPNINFRLKNDYDFPIVLHEVVQKGYVRAEVLGLEQRRTVSFFRRIDEILPFEEEIRESEDVERGKRVLTQRGVPGFKATVYRVVRDGAYAVREKHQDHYPPTTQIVTVGIGDKSKKRFKNDQHPEYTTDEYIVLTQGPGIRVAVEDGKPARAGMAELHEKGRTGTLGWQKREGMKVFEEDEDDEDDKDERKDAN
jgi:vancomycin resistance protein YoaR